MQFQSLVPLYKPPSFSRRAFVKTTATGVLGLVCSGTGVGCASSGRGARRYAGLDSDRYLGPVRVEVQVEGDEVFLEGPAVDRSGTVYFTNIPASDILTWDPAQGRLAVFRDDSRMANGLMFDAQGRLLACEGGAGRVTRTDLLTGRIEVLADAFEGNPLEAPNDLYIDGQGRVYFSSRPGPVPARGYVNAVYRIDPDGSVHQLLRAPDVHMPNGLVVPPGGGMLYLVEADAGVNRNRCIKAYDLRPDGTLSGGRVLIDFYPGRSGDGMCVDAEGNLYVAAGLHALRGTSETLDTRPGIHVVSPTGALLAFRQTPVDTVTNCTFGGADLRTLYVTCGDLLLSIPTQIPGAPFYRPPQ